jgi:uncharacterized protein
VGVVGASARAAVHSLARAGFAAWAVDLFSDRDLARVAPCVSCSFADYPAALPRLAEQSPPGPVLYTGGLENHPHIVAELAVKRELWGNPPAVLEAIRDPWQLFPALTAVGFTVPALVPHGSPCPAVGRWLRKPLRSSAGLGIRFANPGEAASPAHFFQEFIDGTPMSALYVDAKLFGITEQLIGESWLHAKPFSYCGSIGPLELPLKIRGLISHIGFVLAKERGLSGVWNIDFVLQDKWPYTIEVNPRYSASVEVLEHALGLAVYLASGGRQPPEVRTQGANAPPSPGLITVAKAIYYAPRDIIFPAAGPWDADLAGTFEPQRLPAFADIPIPGAIIPAGYPVLTMFAPGSSPVECRERLQFRAAELDRLTEHTP